MTTIKERRREAALAQLNKAIEHREATIGKLVKLEAKIKTLRRQVQRYEKLASAKPKVEASVKPLPPKVLAEAKATADEGIPEFLQRKKEGDERDAKAKAAMIAEQAERKRLKSRGRVERMKAKQSGATTRMPLSGKAALKAIKDVTNLTREEVGI